MKSRFLLIAITVLSITGCAQQYAPTMFMPKNVVASETPATKYSLGQVIVTANKDDVAYRITPESFRIALIQTINRANIFGYDNAKPISIHARILRATYPSSGLTMVSEFVVHYKITSSSGKVLLDRDVKSRGEAVFGEEFLSAADRALKAFKRANQDHFDRLLPQIKEAVSQKKR